VKPSVSRVPYAPNGSNIIIIIIQNMTYKITWQKKCMKREEELEKVINED
jgi:hypothetical protein